jgi:hypothetical protein
VQTTTPKRSERGPHRAWECRDTSDVRRRIISSAVAFVAIAIAVRGSSAAPGASRELPERSEIVAAFAHLVGPPRSAAGLRPYVQGVDGAMAAALARGAVNQRADEASLLPDGTMHVSVVRRLSGSVASVAFAIKQRGQGPPYTWHFVGTAVHSQGRWMASWATVCMLVEQEGVLCPNPPAGVVSALPLPYSVTARQQAAQQSPDLLRPGALALTARGDLLIADSFRDQILEWHPSGELPVFAGTGRPGFSGDGGPALAARLSNLGGIAMSPSGTLYFVDGRRVRAISASGIITTVAGNGRSGPATGNGPALREPLNPSDVAVAKDGTLYIASNDDILTLSENGVLSVFAKGSPPYGDVTTPSGSMAFSPQNIAFDGTGNLDVFSFSPKELFQISPSGSIKLLGGGYTAQMTTAPDGNVLTASHAEQIGQITPTGALSHYLDLSQRIHGLWAPATSRASSRTESPSPPQASSTSTPSGATAGPAEPRSSESHQYEPSRPCRSGRRSPTRSRRSDRPGSPPPATPPPPRRTAPTCHRAPRAKASSPLTRTPLQLRERAQRTSTPTPRASTATCSHQTGRGGRASSPNGSATATTATTTPCSQSSPPAATPSPPPSHTHAARDSYTTPSSSTSAPPRTPSRSATSTSSIDTATHSSTSKPHKPRRGSDDVDPSSPRPRSRHGRAGVRSSRPVSPTSRTPSTDQRRSCLRAL